MLDFITDTLSANDCEPVLAYYEPYRQAPQLSVPSFRLGTRRPGCRQSIALGGFEAYAIGAWLPELEFTHYQTTHLWEEIMVGCSRFLGVSGNIMVATPFLQTGRPYLSWVATDWEEDRKDRTRQFNAVRTLLDRHVNAPRLRALEAKLLRKGQVLALSEYTRNRLDAIAGANACQQVMPMPIDRHIFRPAADEVVKGRIGFSGRLGDPRKNLDLLLHSAAALENSGTSYEVTLIGGQLSESASRRIEQLGIGNRLKVKRNLSRPDLAKLLRTLDVFVVPSHQEGLCISALEAMACGCPVVSTRCGGPGEFVLDDQTGFLVDFDPAAMAEAIRRIIGNRDLRNMLSRNARDLVVERYNREHCERIFWNAFEQQSPTQQEVFS